MILICQSKNLANFFVKTLQILRNQRPEDEEKIDFLSQKKLQLNYGIYCPLNFDNNIEEIGLIEKYLFANSSIIHSKNADEIQNKPNIISFLIKINTKDSSKEMNHFLQNLYQSQVKIIDIVISNNEAFKNNIYDCLNLFNQSLNQTQFVIGDFVKKI